MYLYLRLSLLNIYLNIFLFSCFVCLSDSRGRLVLSGLRLLQLLRLSTHRRRSSSEGLGFRVQGLGFTPLGYRVQGLRLQGLLLRVQGFSFTLLGFRVQVSRVYGLRCRAQGLGFIVECLGFRVQGLGFVYMQTRFMLSC